MLRSMFRVFGILLCLVVLVSCGAKSKVQASGKQGSPELKDTKDKLPSGTVASKGQNFLIHASLSKFAVGTQSVVYKIVSPDMTPVEAPPFSLSVKYYMPTMPEMTITPAVIEALGQGKFKVTYDISMSGAWEIVLSLKDTQRSVSDSITYAFEVAD